MSRLFTRLLPVCAVLLLLSAAATFTALNLNDTGGALLRQAVLNLNGAAAADTINFAVRPDQRNP